MMHMYDSEHTSVRYTELTEPHERGPTRSSTMLQRRDFRKVSISMEQTLRNYSR